MSNKIGTAKKPECVTLPIAGNWCDISLSTDPDLDNAINTSGILVFVETCGAEQKVKYYQDVGGTLEEYTPIGAILDCDSLEEPQIPPPDCPENAVFEQVCIPANSYGILDNSNFVNSPTPHLKNGTALVIDLIHEDGEVTTVGPLADPYFNSFMKEVSEALPNCTVKPVCANHTSPRGCAAVHVANLAEYSAYNTPSYPADIQNNLANPDQSELWATGWLLDCAGCDSPILRAEISDSSVSGYIGAYKDIITYTGEEKTYFRAVTCDGVFWKDCVTGESIPAPAGACCAKPCGGDGVSALLDLMSSMKIVKQGGIPGADYNSAFRYILGRPPASSAWSLCENVDGVFQEPIASGDNLNEFTAALESLGYTEWNFGEEHWVCPCPPGWEQAGDYVIKIDGETSVKVDCLPLSEAPEPPAEKIIQSLDRCAQRVEECNSQSILQEQQNTNSLLTQMLEKMCEPCPLQITVDSQGTLLPLDGNLTTLNGTTQTAFDQFGNTLGQVQVAATLQEGEIVKTAIKLTPIAPLETIDSTIATISTKVVAQGGTAK